MKTIAVLTDFSDRAGHAAMYALRLAQKIKANVLLFNAFLVPVNASYAHRAEWASEDYDEIKKATETKLFALARKLEAELIEKSFRGAYLPAISYQCEEGAVANNIAILEEDKNMALIVLATHGADVVSDFMMGNNCRQVIDVASVPLLIVPQNCAVRDIEKFAFAADIVHNDIDYIKSLTSLAKHFSAEIMVVNVSQRALLSNEEEKALKLFKDEIIHKVNYSRVYYRNIPNDNVKKGLDWLIENVKFDMLVMVHRKIDSVDFVFKSSVTKNIADHAFIPLLVYPYPSVSAPLF